jgi:hypothetical protein
MKQFILIEIIILIIIHSTTIAQTKPGIHFQGIARNKDGIIVANKQMNIKIGLYKDSIDEELVYEEIKSIKTNVLGVFFVNIGKEEEGKIFTRSNWDKIKWEEQLMYIKVEIDPENELQFLSLGYHLINASPYALHSFSVNAENINGIIRIEQGGTGSTSLKDLKILLGIDKINNTPDSLKPITKSTLSLIKEKLNSIDTIPLSSRINLKLNKADTFSLSNRIHQKLNKSDTIYLSNRIEALSQAIPSPKEWGYFYDTSRQTTTVNSATVVQWNFSAASNTATMTNNTAGQPTRVTIQAAGIYKVFFKLQMVKLDIGNEELSIWIRKNSAAYPNSHQVHTIQGGSIRNSFTGNYFLDLGDKDYIEIFYSVRNANIILMSSPTLNNPSRPATPSAYLLIEKIN